MSPDPRDEEARPQTLHLRGTPNSKWEFPKIWDANIVGFLGRVRRLGGSALPHLGVSESRGP